MPDNDTLPMQTPDGKKWDVPRSQVAAMTQHFGAKPLITGGVTQRAVTSFAGVPEETNINPLSRGFYAGTGDLGNYITAVKQAATGLNPLPSMREAESTAEQRFSQPGAWNKLTGAEEWLESGIPYVGPGIVRSHEQIGAGDVAGGVGSAASAGLMGTGLVRAAPVLADIAGRWLPMPSDAGGIVRRPLAAIMDVGGSYEKRIQAEHQQKLETINREYDTKVEQAGERTAEAEANYRLKLEAARDDLAEKQNKLERMRSDYQERAAGAPSVERGESTSAKQSAAELRKKALRTQPRSGPVYQRLAGMADQVATQDVPQLDKDVRVAQNNRWEAFRQAIGDDDPVNPKMVDWSPVQQAVLEAEQNILKGSPENITVFRNILREGVDPTLEGATVFKGTAGNIQEALSSSKMTPEGRARLLESMGRESQFEPRAGSGPLPAQQVQIPFEEARGYYTELGQKITRATGDIRRALKFVQDAADTKAIKPSIPGSQVSVYEALKRDWGQYLGDFYDSDGPLAQLKRAATSDSRLKLITGSKGSNIIDALGRYSRFNPNVTNLAGRLRSLMKQIATVPGTTRAIPERLEPPDLPKPPEPVELSRNPKLLEPLDIRAEKIKKVANKGVEWSQIRPYQMMPWRWKLGIAQRALGALFSDPRFQQWIAGPPK